jgi:putative (di)nucleoside polyphosphate hydrolase
VDIAGTGLTAVAGESADFGTITMGAGCRTGIAMAGSRVDIGAVTGAFGGSAVLGVADFGSAALDSPSLGSAVLGSARDGVAGLPITGVGIGIGIGCAPENVALAAMIATANADDITFDKRIPRTAGSFAQSQTARPLYPRTRHHHGLASGQKPLSASCMSAPTGLPYRPNVGLMILNRAGLVWVGRRVAGAELRNSPVRALAEGWWQMPQGGIDDGEDPRAAAMRELAEETGMRTAHILAESAHWHAYDLPAHLLGRALGGRYRGQTQRWFLIRFTGEETEIDIDPVDHDKEFDIWRWAHVDELPRLIVPFKADVYRAVIEEFRPLIVAGP